jgi:hypothetical protein
MENITIKLVCEDVIDISSKDFTYTNIPHMYKTESGEGVGIQVEEGIDSYSCLRMCNKISSAVREYLNFIREVNNE